MSEFTQEVCIGGNYAVFGEIDTVGRGKTLKLAKLSGFGMAYDLLIYLVVYGGDIWLMDYIIDIDLQG